jgi:hypothetical protein
MGQKRKCDYDKIIEAKRKNKYLTSTGCVKELKLEVTATTIRGIWREAKAQGEL